MLPLPMPFLFSQHGLQSNKHVTLADRKNAEHSSSAVTLSILGFLTKAIRASVFSARNSCTSSLLAISGMAQSCCKRQIFQKKPQTPDLTTLGWMFRVRMLAKSEDQMLTFRKDSRRLFRASTLSLSMFPNGRSGKSFFGPLISSKQNNKCIYLAFMQRHSI